MDRLKARSDILNLIEKVSAKNGFHKYQIKNVATNEKGEGYLGEIFMLDLVEPETEKVLSILIKSAFVDEKTRNIAPIRLSFENEINFYQKVFPEFLKFEMSKQLTANLGHDIVPRCYYASLNDQSEMLALENLKVQGFQTIPKLNIVDEDHLKLIFKTYGRLHAYSFAIKDQEPKTYERITSEIRNVWKEFMNMDTFMGVLRDTVELVYNMWTPGKDDKIIQELEKYRGEGALNMFVKTTTENCKFSALLHGDCWSNNMLFKYQGEEVKTPIDIRLLDFQILKIGSPICDLSYAMYSGTSRKNYDRWQYYLNIYHESLSTCLQRLGSDPQKICPFEALKEEWTHYSKFGFLMGIMVIKMKLVYKEEMIDFLDFDADEDSNAFLKMKFREEEFACRARDLVEHLSEIGAL